MPGLGSVLGPVDDGISAAELDSAYNQAMAGTILPSVMYLNCGVCGGQFRFAAGEPAPQLCQHLKELMQQSFRESEEGHAFKSSGKIFGPELL